MQFWDICSLSKPRACRPPEQTPHPHGAPVCKLGDSHAVLGPETSSESPRRAGWETVPTAQRAGGWFPLFKNCGNGNYDPPLMLLLSGIGHTGRVGWSNQLFPTSSPLPSHRSLRG